MFVDNWRQGKIIAHLVLLVAGLLGHNPEKRERVKAKQGKQRRKQRVGRKAWFLRPFW